MKKFMSIMMAAVIAITGLALTSCGDIAGEMCDKDVWIEKDYEISGQNITAYFYYTDKDGYTSDVKLVDFVTTSDDEEAVNAKDAIKAGLNIFVKVNSGSDTIDAAVGKMVLFRNFPKGKIVDTSSSTADASMISKDEKSTDEEASSASFLDNLKMSDEIWLAIEIYQKLYGKGETAIPEYIKAKSNYKVSTDIQALFKNMSWKKVLASLLVSQLTDSEDDDE